MEEFVIIQKMNQDVSERFLAEGEVRYAFNIRPLNSQFGSTGAATNVEGNSEVVYTFPAGGNRVVDSFSDIKNKRIYYLVWNSINEHSLLEYDETTKEITLIFRGVALELESETLIANMRTVDTSEGTAILWTDGNSEPKKVYRETGARTFNISAAGGTGINTGDYSTNIGGNFNEGQCVKGDFTGAGSTSGLYYIAKTNTTQSPEQGTSGVLSSEWDYMPSGYIYKFDSISGADLTIPSERISRMPQAPLEPVPCVFERDDSLAFNDIAKNCWQFAYKWRYFDGQESHLSPWSEVPVNYIAGDPDRLNVIKLFFDIPLDKDISDIILYSQGFRNDNTKTDAALFKKVAEFNINNIITNGITENNATEFTYTYTNREGKSATNPIDSQQLFYNVPRKSGSLAVTSSNRVIDGDVTEGYETPLANPTSTKITSVEFEDYVLSSATPFTITALIDGFSVDFDELAPYGTSQNIVFRFDYTETTNYVFGAPAVSTRSIALNYLTNSTDDASSIADFFETALGDIVFEGVSQFNINRAVNVISVQEKTINSNQEEVVSVTFTPEDTANIDLFFGENNKSFKRRSVQDVGIAYFEKYGRVTSIVSNDALNITVDTQVGSTATNNGVVDAIKVYVAHEPPEDAVKYSIFKKNSSYNFVQIATSIDNTTNQASLNNSGNPNNSGNAKFFVRGQIEIDSNGDEAKVTASPSDFLYIYLNALNGDGENAYINANEADALSYSFTEGDRVVFIHEGNLPAGGGTPNAWFGDEAPILEYDPTFNRIKVNPSDLPDTLVGVSAPFAVGNEDQTASAAAGFLIGIYTPPQNTEESFFFETGEIRDISNGFHLGSLSQDEQDQTSTAPAIILLQNGTDCYVRTRDYMVFPNQVVSYLVEDPNMTDQYESKCTDLGRANLEYRAELTDESASGRINEQRNEGKLIYSEAFDETTLLNRLGTVYSLNFRQVDQAFGDIQYIYSEGDRLDVYQKERVALIYIDRSITTSIGGNAQVIQNSDSVLSDYQYYAAINGISDFPTSFAAHGNRRYFVDAARGVVLRKSNDGITEISAYGMDGYFKNILKNINDNGGEVIGWYDIRFDEYVLNLKFNSTVDVTPSDYIGAGTTEAKATFPPSVYMSQFVIGTQIMFQGVTRVYTGTIMDKGSDFIDVDLGLAIDKTEFLADTLTAEALDSQTLAFSEGVRGWTTFYGYIPDYADSGTIDMVSWKAGALYTHNNGSYNNFYGEDFTSEITFIGNEAPSGIKSPKTIGLRVEGLLFTDDLISSDVVETSTNQTSNIPSAMFSYREGDWYAPFLRDTNTENTTTPLFNGDYLKGAWVSANIVLASGVNKLVKILGATFKYAVSQYTR